MELTLTKSEFLLLRKIVFDPLDIVDTSQDLPEDKDKKAKRCPRWRLGGRDKNISASLIKKALDNIMLEFENCEELQREVVNEIESIEGHDEIKSELQRKFYLVIQNLGSVVLPRTVSFTLSDKKVSVLQEIVAQYETTLGNAPESDYWNLVFAINPKLKDKE